MSVVLPALAVAFIAFCVWLTIRTVNRRERWAKRTAAALVVSLPLLYPLSFGPACWWFSSKRSTPAVSGVPEAPVLYLPIGWIYDCSPEGSWREKAIGWYATLFITGEDGVLVPSGPAGKSVFVFNPSRGGV